MNYFYKKTQTYCCEKTLDCFQNNKLYIARDIIGTAALAHITKHITDKEIGVDATEWTAHYPTDVALARFLYKCRALNIKVKLFNYTIVRPELDAIMADYGDILESAGAYDF